MRSVRAVALFHVFGFGILLEMAGLSMAMGRSLAGVLASSEYRHALESDIQPFKGLLLGLFFIGVGMSIDFGTLFHHPPLIASLLLGFMLIKAALLWLIGPLLGVPKLQRGLFAILLGQGSEFAFVIFSAAQLAGVLPVEWAKSLTLAVAPSMAATPLLLVIAAQLEKNAPKEERPADVIDDENASVIIAGFGRFGQIAGLLLAAYTPWITMDAYRPNSTPGVLRRRHARFAGAAGAAHAKVLINAIDDVEGSGVNRAGGAALPASEGGGASARRRSLVSATAAGVEKPERETFESSLRIGRETLELLGWMRRARRRIRSAANLKMLEDTLENQDTEFRIASLQRAKEMLSAAIEQDQNRLARVQQTGWRGSIDGKAPEDEVVEAKG